MTPPSSWPTNSCIRILLKLRDCNKSTFHENCLQQVQCPNVHLWLHSKWPPLLLQFLGGKLNDKFATRDLHYWNVATLESRTVTHDISPMDPHPDSKRYPLDAAYLHTLEIGFLKEVIKAHQKTDRLSPQWRICDNVQTAVNFLVTRGATINWIVDAEFRFNFEQGKITLPNSAQSKAPVSKAKSMTPPATLITASPDADDLPQKVLVIITDERRSNGMAPRVVSLLVKLRRDVSLCWVDTIVLLQKLQQSSEAIVGSARFSVEVKIGPETGRGSFYIMREDDVSLHQPEVPELSVFVADANTGCAHMIHIYLDAECFKAVKRHYATLSTDNEAEEEYRKSASNRSTPLLQSVQGSGSSSRPSPEERASAQVRWLAGPSGYRNDIAKAISEMVKKGGQYLPTCTLAIFCYYVYIVANVTPGDNCEPAGRSDIKLKTLAAFLDVAPDWIGGPKTVGHLQIEVGHDEVVRAHMDGDVISYMGLKSWKKFLGTVAEQTKVKDENDIQL
ncbi:hypothetical protein C8R43DRAFT_956153 [Mycena crocata]|nr:hypothetical protein C8R43DRAFT_956153 [Mycena crocata]